MNVLPDFAVLRSTNYWYWMNWSKKNTLLCSFVKSVFFVCIYPLNLPFLNVTALKHLMRLLLCLFDEIPYQMSVTRYARKIKSDSCNALHSLWSTGKNADVQIIRVQRITLWRNKGVMDPVTVGCQEDKLKSILLKQ